MAANLFARLLGLLSGEPADVSPADTETQLADLTDLFNTNVQMLAEGLTDGTITLDEFDSAMRAEIRSQQLGAAVIGAGGALQATPETYQLAQQQVDAQMVYFDNWIQQLRGQQAAGELPSAAYLANRAKLYGKAAGATLSEAVTRAKGVPVLPFYPRDGKTQCRVNCCCNWSILPLRGVDNYDCFYILDPTCDHCPQCIARRLAASPLRVRNGVIVNPERYLAPELYA